MSAHIEITSDEAALVLGDIRQRHERNPDNLASENALLAAQNRFLRASLREKEQECRSLHRQLREARRATS